MKEREDWERKEKKIAIHIKCMYVCKSMVETNVWKNEINKTIQQTKQISNKKKILTFKKKKEKSCLHFHFQSNESSDLFYAFGYYSIWELGFSSLGPMVTGMVIYLKICDIKWINCPVPGVRWTKTMLNSIHCAATINQTQRDAFTRIFFYSMCRENWYRIHM